MRNLIILSLLLSIFTQENLVDIRLESINLKDDHLKVGVGMLMDFKVVNRGNQTVPANAFKMEMKINGNLVSLDNLPEAMEPNAFIHYTKEEGKFHYMVKPTDETVLVQIKLTPKEGFKLKDNKSSYFEKRYKVNK